MCDFAFEIDFVALVNGRCLQMFDKTQKAPRLFIKDPKINLEVHRPPREKLLVILPFVNVAADQHI